MFYKISEYCKNYDAINQITGAKYAGHKNKIDLDLFDENMKRILNENFNVDVIQDAIETINQVEEEMFKPEESPVWFNQEVQPFEEHQAQETEIIEAMRKARRKCNYSEHENMYKTPKYSQQSPNMDDEENQLTQRTTHKFNMTKQEQSDHSKKLKEGNQG